MLHNNLEFSDDAGNVVASFEKTSKCGASRALVTLGGGRGGHSGLAVASLHHHYRGRHSWASVLLYEGEESDALVPDISVRGDLAGHSYKFLMAGRTIAQVHCYLPQVEGPAYTQVRCARLRPNLR